MSRQATGHTRTIYNRFIRWSEMGVFGRIFIELAKGGERPVLRRCA